MKKLRFILSALVAVLFVTAAYVASATAQVQVWNGDLDGSTNANKIVTGLQGRALPAPAVGYLASDGGAWYWGAGGGVTAGDAGQFLVTNDAGATAWAYPHGDVDASATDPGALTVTALLGRALSTSAPTSGNTLSWNGTSWLPRALDLSGGSGYVVNTLPASNQAAQTMNGDVTGTTAANVVASLTGSAGAVTVPSATHLAFGTTPASAGAIRLPSNSAIEARNAGNSLDFKMIAIDASDHLDIGYPGVGTPTIWASGGWSLAWSGGTLSSGAGLMHVGTNAGAAYHTYVMAGAGLDVIDVSVLSGAGSEMSSFAGTIETKATTAPTSGAANTHREYTDTADGKLKVKDSAGNIFVLAP